MTYEPIWGLPIAAYLFLAGLGGGAFMTSAIIAWKHPSAVFARKAGRIIAPIVVAIGLVLLMTDAQGGFKNPMRFALLLHNTGSVMTWGVYFLAIFEVIALIELLLEILKKDCPRWLDLIGSIFAVCVGAYTGCLLGVVKTFPLWNNSILPVLFLVSAVSTGMAIVVLCALIKAPKEAEQITTVKNVHFWLPIVELVLVCAMLFIVNTADAQGHASVMGMLTGKYALMFWLCFIVVGLVGPAAIEIAGKVKHTESRGAEIVSETGVVVGGFFLRLLIVLAALPVTMVVPTIL